MIERYHSRLEPRVPTPALNAMDLSPTAVDEIVLEPASTDGEPGRNRLPIDEPDFGV